MDYSTETDNMLFADLCEVDRAAEDIVKRCEKDGKTVHDALLELMNELHAIAGCQIFSAGNTASGYCGITCKAGMIEIWVPQRDDAYMTFNRLMAVAIECVTHAIENRSLVRFQQRTSVFALNECHCEQCRGVVAA